jgi:hypothetical protein
MPPFDQSSGATIARHRWQYRRWRQCRVRINGDNFERLMRAAQSRGIEPSVLLERVVATVIGADLINAVLDDR